MLSKFGFVFRSGDKEGGGIECAWLWRVNAGVPLRSTMPRPIISGLEKINFHSFVKRLPGVRPDWILILDIIKL